MTAAARPLKIIGVNSFMNAAGAQEAQLRLARNLRARGHQMEVWFIYEEAPAHRDEPGVRILFPKPKLGPAEYVRAFLQLHRRLAAEKPDAVVGFLPLGAVFGTMAGLLAGVPVRLASQRAPGPTYGKAMRLLDRLWGQFGVYTAVVCVSDAVRRSFDGYPAAYRRKLSVVHNGIDWTPSPLGKAQARAALGLPHDGVIFAALGRFKSQKNYPFMLERAAEVPGLQLAIAGDGEGRAAAESFVREQGLADRVRFLGNLDSAGARTLYAAADVFIQTSLYEGQSNAVLEAMHAGLPMLVSDIPMNRETLVDGQGADGGWLAHLDDAADWRTKLERLRDDGGVRAELGRAAHAMVGRRFTLKAMIDGFERTLQDQAARRLTARR